MAEFEILAIGLDEVDAPAKFAKSEVGGVSPTGKSSSELRVCVLRCA